MSCGKVNRNARLTTPQKENNMQEKDFVSYEYRTKTVKSKDMTKATDMYEAFGWEVTSAAHTAVDNTTLSLKRDRKQKHKQELSRLERQAEEIFGTINNLQRAKTLGASVFSYIFGCIAALLLGGGMSLIMLNQNNFAAFVGGIALGIAGIALRKLFYLQKNGRKENRRTAADHRRQRRKACQYSRKRQRPA